MLTVSVLGPVEVRRDGERLPVRPGKTTEVLVRLALEAGAAVRTERLIEDLWGEDAVATQRNTLQTKVSRLRKELGDGTLVVADASGYTLRVEPAAVDALDVVQQAASVRELLDAGDAVSALRIGTDALAAYRGEVLTGAGDGDWVLPHRTRLVEVRHQLVEDVVAARLELGATGEVTGELEALVAAHPLRERAWSLLVTALYRDGRQADALAAYTRVRTVLAEELGLEPGPELRALEQQVLEHDPALAPVARVVAGNLPALTSSLVGRDTDLAALVPLVAAERLVTLVGPAGVGKTRLAVEVARATRRDAGTWLVRLEVATDPETVAETIAAALQVADGRAATLLERLRGADLLLVLDNCEHVADAVADLVPRILDVAPGLHVLCTSQVALGLDGEATYELAPLAVDDAVELFARRAGAQRRSFTLGADNEDAVRDLCVTLDGLPLAIELAAARAKTLSVDDIARRLDDRFTLLRDTTTRRPPRQRALATAIDWSYDLLFPDDQRGLWALACFTGGATLPAVEHVLAALDVPSRTALDVVDRLVHRSLVVVDPTPAGSLRYRLLDSVRAYATVRLHEAGEDLADRAFGAHAGWYGEAAITAQRETRGPGQGSQLAFVRDERANIDAALAWTLAHDPELALRIVDGFGWAWVVAGDGALVVARLLAALDAGADAPAAVRARVWSHTAWLAAGNDVAVASNAASTAVDLADDELGAASARLALAFAMIQDGRAVDALTELGGCRSEFARLGHPWEEGSAWVLTVHAALASGDGELAARACAAAEPIVQRTGDDWGMGHLDAVLGRVAQADGRFADATAHLRRAAAAAARLGFATSEGYHLVNLGGALHDAGDDEQACAVLERAVEIGTTTAELRLAAIARTHLGRVLLAGGERESARSALVTADTWFRSSGGGDGADLAASLLLDVGT